MKYFFPLFPIRLFIFFCIAASAVSAEIWSLTFCCPSETLYIREEYSASAHGYVA